MGADSEQRRCRNRCGVDLLIQWSQYEPTETNGKAEIGVMRLKWTTGQFLLCALGSGEAMLRANSPSK